MARVLDMFPPNGAGRPKKYDIDKWLDGQVWELTFGEDYTCSPEAFRSSLYVAARKLNLRLTSRAVGKDKLVIQANPLIFNKERDG